MLKRVWFPILIVIIFLILIIDGSVELSKSAMIFPWIIGAFGGILLVWEIIRETRGKQEKAPDEARSQKPATAYLSVAWLVAIVPMICLLGFFVSIPLHLFLSLKFNGEKWLLSVVLTVIVGAFFYLAFYVAMKVPFYEGLLFSCFMD